MQPINSQSTETAISTIITGYIVSKFGLDNIYYGFMYSIVLSACGYLFGLKSSSQWVPEGYSWIFYVFIPIISSIGIYLGYKYYKKIKINNYIYIHIYDRSTVNKMIKYFSLYPKMLQQDCDITLSNPDHEFQILTFNNMDQKSQEFTETFDKNIPYNDTNFGLEGYICWKKNAKEIPGIANPSGASIPSKTLYITSLEIAIKKSTGRKINTKKIINNIIKEVDKRTANFIELKYVKLLNGNTYHSVSMYKGEKQDFKTREKHFIHSFFHQERDHLWTIIKKIHQEPNFFINQGQGARINLLLHGPSGSGKSTFIYRIAMCMDRNILSLDLRDLNKVNLYSLIQNPNLNIYITGMTNGKDTFKNYVILFEEFDTSILEIHEKSMKEKVFDEKLKNILSPAHQGIVQGTGVVDQNKNDCSVIKLRDLLEIFQGPVPMHGMIIMATTNKYDEIRGLCPELFRPGRLTPIFFGYITSTVLQEISMYYFGQKLTYRIPEAMTIPTSQIIDLAMESKINNKSFEYFSNALAKLL